MKIIRRNKLRRGGFAGLRETRLVMSPRIFRGQQEAGTSPGIGRFVYLADASFLPHGDTRMHSHREIDVISIMVEGRIKHEGSMEDGQELNVDNIQVQRAGGEGFTHNEINPDDAKNRMIQIWVLPESQGEPHGPGKGDHELPIGDFGEHLVHRGGGEVRGAPERRCA